VLQALGDGVAVLDRQGRILLANLAFARIAGFSQPAGSMPDLPQYQDLFDLVSPEGGFPRSEHGLISSILRGETVSDRRLVLRRRDSGVEAPVSFTGAPVLDAQGALEAAVLIHRDLSGQQRAEEESLRNERRYRDLLETLDDGFCVLRMEFDANGKAVDYSWLETNAAFEKQTGLKDAVGRNVRTLVPDLDESWFRLYGKVALTGEAIRFENYAPAMGRWFDVHASRTGRPEERQVALVFKDITERKRAEETLHRFALLVEASNDFISLADSSGICTFLNVGGSRLVALTAGECPGRHLIDFVLPEDAPVFRRILEQARAEGTSQGEIRFRNLVTDTVIPVLCHLFQLRSSDSGKPIALALVARDLTEVREKEEQLRQAQKVEAIGRLAGGVAHDFNNLLTAINGYSEILLETMPADDPKRGFVEEIQGAGRKAAALTSQLLAYSRMQVLQPRILDLNGLVQESVRLLRRIIGEDIVVHLDLEPALLPVMADPNQMHQALLNLCLNSRDSMPGGGDLTLATRNASSSVPVKDGPDGRRSMVVLEVKDTGIGMTPETRERIFEPFFTTRLDLGPTRGAGGKGVGAGPTGRTGKGLGLSSVEGIVRQSGGRIEVRSEPGRGSTFSIFLPVAEAGETGDIAKAPEEHPRAESRKGTILLVEDEEAVRKFVRNVLEREGYAVMEARDGLEGETLLESTGARPDLLLSDIIMPRMGGVQLARSVRKSHPEIPILLMSGYTEEDFNRQAETDESFPVLQKPFSTQALFGRISELLSSSGRP
jgi:PAS domain S-box-containing protein